MASNVYLTDPPDQLWNSAYSDIKFVFDFKYYLIGSITEQIVSSVGTGKSQLNLTVNWDFNPSKNEYITIDAGNYAGIHKVLSSTNNTVVIDYEYIGIASTICYVKSLRVPKFTLYKGFVNGEDFPTQLPYQYVTDFTYLYNNNYQIEINIKGLVQKCFDIKPPNITEDYDYNVFNAFRLAWDDQITQFILVLNSSIPSLELNAQYISNGRPLTNVDEQIIWGCGNTFYTIIENGYPKIKIFNGIQQVVAGFSNAFQTNQFSQGFDIN